MKVSVIVPCFNNERLITDTLESVIQQTYFNWECIVVDDGSDDRSVEKILSYVNRDHRFRLLKRPSDLPKGANSCRNYGVLKSSGEYLIFLDADDLLANNCIERRVNSISVEDLIIHSTAHFTEEIDQASPFFPNLNSNLSAIEYRNMFLEYMIPWHTSSGIWKKDFFNEINGFNDRLLRFQDVDLHVRALSFPLIKFKLDDSSSFTSYYRKSEFHQKVTKEKRRFILNQGLAFASELKSLLKPNDFISVQGLFVYLLFRFEEVVGLEDLKVIKNLMQTNSGESESHSLAYEFNFLVWVYGTWMTNPSRFRKYLSFIVFKKYSYSIRKKLNH
ncbi:glycosyltransferase family 2 protein [Algoriphagus lutimaris]|uniref:glycosyltransferase family 2 protein n=1 Tax=Algoriphagus lutimaris TaxID=613197 RepID=UPI00196A36C5|nr:glycosyltransferase family 2 protein [Algoriphagus lutimaris]MBN3518678.1 glycosyltransferase family 2 protein [Algoriphagus lutimaris]